MKNILLIILICLPWLTSAQQEKNYTQTVRGTVIDKDSRQPLIGAAVVVLDTEPLKGAVADERGQFRIENVPIGRHTLKVSYLGYEPVLLNNVEITSGKEVVLQIEMKESFVEKEVVEIVANKRKDQPNNEMSTVSARLFTVEETQRYAGSLGDPARMAANFAGVMSAADQKNDIIIRGNSPTGLLWRMDGIDIPNPNHFAAQGSTGGPISMINANLLRNSDFFSGAWPAEYGNALSGVFDLKLRPGNNEQYEFTGQVGFNGFEAMAEGPISKDKGSSFIGSYRYSVLSFIETLGFNLGTAGVPKYQDLSFKLVFPGQKAGHFEVFGIGGISDIEMLESQREADDNTFGVRRQDIRFGSRTGVGGISHMKMIGKSGYIKNIVAYTTELHTVDTDTLNEQKEPFPFYNESGTYNKLAYHGLYNHKINANNTIRVGTILSRLDFDNLQEVYRKQFDTWQTINDAEGNTYHAQPYAQWRHSFSQKLSMSSGLHYQYFFLNNTSSLEPRVGFSYALNNLQTISLGYGLHGQLQILPLYFYEKPIFDPVTGAPVDYVRTNQDIGFTRSHQIVAGYDHLLAENLRLKTEVYYQYLFNVPVSETGTYSTLNAGADFTVQLAHDLVNEGNGRNYGLELTLEKFFSKQYYFLFTTSLFDSRYKTTDDVWRNTAFNGHYILNALAGKEFNLGRNSRLTFSVKYSTAGGRWHTPIDVTRSNIARQAVYKNSEAFTLQYPRYEKLDLRLGFKINSRTVTQEWALDLQNVTNNKNVLTENYDPEKQEVRYEYQLSFFPIMLYRIQF